MYSYDCIDVYRYKYECTYIIYMKDSNNRYLCVMGLWVNPMLKKIFFKGKAVLE